MLFFTSIVGNILLILTFIRALLLPAQNIDFLSSIGPVLFITEFLTIHSSGMAQGNFDPKTRLKMLFFYGLFLIPIFSISKNITLAAIFLLSLISKILFRKSIPSKQYTLYSIIILSICFLIIFLSPIINSLVKLPPEIQAQIISRGDGLIYESPQTFMVWGVLYFSLLTALQIFLGYQNLKKKIIN